LAPDVVFAADVLQRQFGLEAQEFALDVAQQIGFAPFLVEVLCERLPPRGLAFLSGLLDRLESLIQATVDLRQQQLPSGEKEAEEREQRVISCQNSTCTVMRGFSLMFLNGLAFRRA
jgi:hypothetical protein